MWLKQAWSCCLKEFPDHRSTVGDVNVRIVKTNPFRNIRLKLLPKKIEKQFRNDFKAKLSLMDKCPDLRTDQVDIDLDSSFELAIYYVKQNVDYKFMDSK